MNLQKENLVYNTVFNSASWFTNNLVDVRFNNSELRLFRSPNTYDSNELTFTIPPLAGGVCYKFSNLNAYVEVQMTKEDGSAPAATVDGSINCVQPRQNIGHSLFSRIEYKIKDKVVNRSSDHYGTKAYILTLLDSAFCHRPLKFMGDGFYDTLTVIDADGLTENAHRNRYGKWVPVPGSQTEKTFEYTVEPVSYCFKLKGDLMEMQVPLPPGLGCDIVFTQSSMKHRIRAMKKDSEKYKLTITKMVLYCEMSQLSDEMLKDFTKTIKTRPALLPYKKYKLLTRNIPSNTTEYSWDTLFSEKNLHPSKVLFGFIRTNAMIGEYHLNSTVFSRAWHKADPGLPLVVRTTNNPGEDIGAVNPDDFVFVKQCKLMRDEKEYDLMDEPTTFRNVMQAYRRLAMVEGWFDLPFASGLSYHDFAWGGLFFKAYDLTCNGMASLKYLTPLIKRGSYSLTVEFSEQMPHEITIIAFCEYANVTSVNNDDEVSVSYID